MLSNGIFRSLSLHFDLSMFTLSVKKVWMIKLRGLFSLRINLGHICRLSNINNKPVIIFTSRFKIKHPCRLSVVLRQAKGLILSSGWCPSLLLLLYRDTPCPYHSSLLFFSKRIIWLHHVFLAALAGELDVLPPLLFFFFLVTNSLPTANIFFFISIILTWNIKLFWTEK